MKKFQILFCILLASCITFENDNDVGPRTYYLNSDPYQGFSVEKMEVINYDSSSFTPSFYLSYTTDFDGDIDMPALMHPSQPYSFGLLEEFDNQYAAINFYDEKIDDSIIYSLDFQHTAYSIKPYQIWIVKISNSGLAKLLITQTSVNNYNTPHTEITFQCKKIK